MRSRFCLEAAGSGVCHVCAALRVTFRIVNRLIWCLSGLPFRFPTPVPFGPHINADGKEAFLASRALPSSQIK